MLQTDSIKRKAYKYGIMALILIFVTPLLVNVLDNYIPLTGVFGNYVLTFITMFVLLLVSDIALDKVFNL